MQLFYLIDPQNYVGYVLSWRRLCHALDTEDKFLQLGRCCTDGTRPYLRFGSLGFSAGETTKKWLKLLFCKILDRNNVVILVGVFMRAEAFLNHNLLLLFKKASLEDARA